MHLLLRLLRDRLSRIIPIPRPVTLACFVDERAVTGHRNMKCRGYRAMRRMRERSRHVLTLVINLKFGLTSSIKHDEVLSLDI